MDADLQRIVSMVIERLRAAEGRTFEIERKVVTLADVEGRLQEIEVVQVSKRAVVTPAVRDFLKDRKIELRYRSGVSPAIGVEKNEPPTLLIAIAETKISPALAAGCLPSAAGAVVLGGNKTLTEVVKEVSELLRNATTHVVLLTENPHAAVCWANRDARVCAATVSCVAELGEAMRSIDVNLLVLNPAQLSVYLLRSIVKRFSAG